MVEVTLANLQKPNVSITIELPIDEETMYEILYELDACSLNDLHIKSYYSKLPIKINKNELDLLNDALFYYHQDYYDDYQVMYKLKALLELNIWSKNDLLDKTPIEDYEFYFLETSTLESLGYELRDYNVCAYNVISWSSYAEEYLQNTGRKLLGISNDAVAVIYKN